MQARCQYKGFAATVSPRPLQGQGAMHSQVRRLRTAFNAAQRHPQLNQKQQATAAGSNTESRLNPELRHQKDVRRWAAQCKH
eukprot:CAMPEP_0172711572 /NCGR_PEP_ID=MMETSP1074-20121228/59579_1 /TAXON_ID=2916 /ORGANISM="Ceratium fusus, Strain PA161109" /LENGTH=81 /DNA_ID=CAMNT_0013535299 /DNA_START=24 /DNA_END=266 /DNA_ORIENTATION=-